MVWKSVVTFVVTYGIREKPVLSYQTFITFPSLSYLPTFVALSNFCHLIKLLSFSHPLLSIYFLRYLTTYKCTCCPHHKQNAYSRLIVRTLSAPIHLSNPTGVFGHRAILIWGDRDMAGGLLEEQPVTFKLKRRRQYLWNFSRD